MGWDWVNVYATLTITVSRTLFDLYLSVFLATSDSQVNENGEWTRYAPTN